jgi:hypothetical protein
MKTPSCCLLFVKTMLVLVAGFFLAPMSVAQAVDVEIELAGPWSYVQDQHDPTRILVVVPNAGHLLSVFSGEDINNYGSTPTPPGMHELDFTTASCGTHPLSSAYLYPVNGVSNTPNSPFYTISLPKPCYYESHAESRFKYGAQPPADADPERSFTTWMILHYKVVGAAPTASLDNGAVPIPFSGTTKKAISIVTYINMPPDSQCDSHSSHAFYLTESLWNLQHVYRVFPNVQDLTNANQQCSTYDYKDCDKNQDTAVGGLASPQCPTPPSLSASKGAIAREKPKSPGRADCHAAQVNVNGVVQ